MATTDLTKIHAGSRPNAAGLLILALSGFLIPASSLQAQTSPSAPADAPKKAVLPFDVSGYFSFRQLKGEEPGSRNAFREYAFSLFLDKAISKWRFHTEFNSEKSPHFDNDGILFGPDSIKAHLHTAWVNFQQSDALQGRAGFLFVPTYWRTHRYQSTTLTVADPLIDRRIFPTGVVGAMAHGNKLFDDGGFSYTVYGGVAPRIGKPELPTAAGEGGEGEGGEGEDDHHTMTAEEFEAGRARSAGGTFLAHLPNGHRMNVLDFGFQYLHQTYSNHMGARIYGFESRIEKGRAALLAEFAHSSILEPGGERLYMKEGLYVQPSYRVLRNLFGVYRYDALNLDSRNTERGTLTRHTAGVTWRPIANLSLKAEYNRFEFTRGEHPTYSGASAGVVYYFLFR